MSTRSAGGAFGDGARDISLWASLATSAQTALATWRGPLKLQPGKMVVVGHIGQEQPSARMISDLLVLVRWLGRGSLRTRCMPARVARRQLVECVEVRVPRVQVVPVEGSSNCLARSVSRGASLRIALGFVQRALVLSEMLLIIKVAVDIVARDGACLQVWSSAASLIWRCQTAAEGWVLLRTAHLLRLSV